MTEQKLIELLRDMSLEEKVNQMSQVTGGFFNGEIVVTGPMEDKGFTEDNVNLAGSVIGSMGAETLKSIQKNYMEKHPHHIPLLFMLDVINGYKTVFPIPLAQGASFEPELSEQCASVAAKEASVSGLHVTFAPMTDLVRDARWGRVMESTGEDPYLNSLFCAAMVRGFQGNSLKDNYAIAACVKHFAGYGAPTAGREYNTVELSEHTFREFYLPSYQAGIDAGAALVMTSFNTVNGIPATGNKKLMRDILREQMKFDGVLISDWAAIEEIIYHGYCADREEAAMRAVEAGVDIDMMTGIYCENLCQMVRDGKIREELIDEACLRILRLKNNLGLFENPYKDADQKKEQEYILCEEHRKLAREAAKKSFVLLKNEDHILPLEQQKKIAFIGPYVDNRNLLGAWSFIADAKDVMTLHEAVQEQYVSENSTFCQGSPMLGADVCLEGFGEQQQQSYTQEQENHMLREAVQAAKLRLGGTGATVRAIVACKGTDCRKGMFDVHAFACRLDKEFYGIDVPKKFKIGVFGCLNSLGKAMAQDIGVVPSFTEPGKFEIYIGGLLGNRPVQGKHIPVPLKEEMVADAIRYVLDIYKTNGIYPQRLRTVLDDKKELWQEINYYFKSLAK